ncbi:MAG: hypothetical protein RI946_684 [Pseudomonadota bacterium]|jgi:hypothetical protein
MKLPSSKVSFSEKKYVFNKKNATICCVPFQHSVTTFSRGPISWAVEGENKCQNQ